MADLEVRVGPPIIVVHADDHFVVSEPDGTIDPVRQQGFFASDTRLISRYHLRINGAPPTLLNSAAVTASGARYEFTNPQLGSGEDSIPKHVVHLRIDRAVGDGVHEDYDLVNYHRADIDVTLEVAIESDFSDIFDVKAGTVVRRGTRETRWSESRLETVYRNGEFERAVRVEIVSSSSEAHYADGSIWFRAATRAAGSLERLHLLVAHGRRRRSGQARTMLPRRYRRAIVPPSSVREVATAVQQLRDE